MPIPLQITFRGMSASDALRADIEKHAAKLEQFADQILGCQVVMEPAEKHHHKGNRYQIHLSLQLPERDIHVSRDPALMNREFEDPYVVVRDTFDAARRQLEDYIRERRDTVKKHPRPGSVT